MINAIKFSIEEIEASDQYFDHTGNRPALKILGAALQIESVGQFSPAEIAGLEAR